MSVLPNSSDAPANTFKSSPSASIFTIAGMGNPEEVTISFNVRSGISIVRTDSLSVLGTCKKVLL